MRLTNSSKYVELLKPCALWLQPLLYSTNTHISSEACSLPTDGERHKRIKPLVGLCRVWDCQVCRCAASGSLQGQQGDARQEGADSRRGSGVRDCSTGLGQQNLYGAQSLPPDPVQKCPLQMKGHPRLPQAGKHNIHWTLFTSKCEGLINGNKWQR